MNTNRLIQPLAIVILTLGLSPAFAELQQADATVLIHFKGSSTLHDFEGTVKTRSFTATFFTDENNHRKITATADFNVQDMNTENTKRDKKMRNMLEHPRFSTISATFDNADIPDTGTGTASLKVKIRDIEQSITATLSEWKIEGNLASCHMTFPVSLKAFNLKAPSVVGLIRVGDTVDVECKLQAVIKPMP